MNCRMSDGSMMLVAAMSLNNRRRERKHDQDDRRSQHSHNPLFNHHGSILSWL
jgi:hypothetical protein